MLEKKVLIHFTFVTFPMLRSNIFITRNFMGCCLNCRRQEDAFRMSVALFGFFFAKIAETSALDCKMFLIKFQTFFCHSVFLINSPWRNFCDRNEKFWGCTRAVGWCTEMFRLNRNDWTQFSQKSNKKILSRG